MRDGHPPDKVHGAAQRMKGLGTTALTGSILNVNDEHDIVSPPNATGQLCDPALRPGKFRVLIRKVKGLECMFFGVLLTLWVLLVTLYTISPR